MLGSVLVTVVQRLHCVGKGGINCIRFVLLIELASNLNTTIITLQPIDDYCFSRFSPNGMLMASCAQDGFVYLHNTTNGAFSQSNLLKFSFILIFATNTTPIIIIIVVIL